jgi:hypothetical protein
MKKKSCVKNKSIIKNIKKSTKKSIATYSISQIIVRSLAVIVKKFGGNLAITSTEIETIENDFKDIIIEKTKNNDHVIFTLIRTGE